MGTYMGIGIVTKMGISKSTVEEMESTIDDIQSKISKEFNIDFDIYTVVENDNAYIFNLKDTIMEEQLKPFLQEIYPAIYSDSNYYESILKYLDKLKADKIIEFAKEKSKEAFQYDKYGERDYFYGSFGRCLEISYETIMISSEGKISMECYGKHFKFFKSCIVKAYPQYSIANSLRVYITG